MSIKKRKEIKFKLEAEWIDWDVNKGGNRRSWLFYIFCAISSLSSLAINGEDINILVNQYFKQYADLHEYYDTKNVYSAIIIVNQQKIKIQIRKHDTKRRDILCFEC